MAVVVDPGRLDPHHRGDERCEKDRFGSSRSSIRSAHCRGSERLGNMWRIPPAHASGLRVPTLTGSSRHGQLPAKGKHENGNDRGVERTEARPQGDRASDRGARRDSSATASSPRRRCASSTATPDLDRQPAARRGGVSAIDRGRAGDRAHLRAAPRAGHPVRHRHLARRPCQRAARRRLARLPRHEPGARGPRRGSRLRGRAGRHPQAAQRVSARPGPVLSRSIPAPTPRSAAWRRRAPPAPMRCATAR